MLRELRTYGGIFRYAIAWLFIIFLAGMPRLLYQSEKGSLLFEGNEFRAVASQADAELLPSAVAAARTPVIDFSNSAVQAYNAPHLYRRWDVAEPSLDAPLVLAVDLDSGFVFFRKGDLHTRWPIASISKLITASVASQALDMATLVTIEQSDVDTEGLSGDLHAEDIYSVDALTRIMLLTSSNDAAAALGRAVGTDFALRMREKAVSIGMKETALIEPTGLSEMNRSTTGDLSRLLKYFVKSEPDIFSITVHSELSVQERRSKRSRIIKNINNFSGSSNFIGGKTGFIDSSGGNLVSVFQYQRFTIATIVLGAADRFGETQKVLDFIKAGYKF